MEPGGPLQGGLLIVVASKMLGDPARFEALVARTVLLGAPLAGTMRASDALVFGSDELGRDERAFASAMSRTWPSLYQMLPSWPAVLDQQGEPLPATSQLLELGGWPRPDGVTADLLQRAKDVHGMLRDPTAAIGGTPMATVLTSNKPTKVSMVRTVDAGVDGFEKDRYDGGDSLVPFKLTRAWGGPQLDQIIVHLTGNVRAHAFLGVDEEIVAFVERFIGDH